MGIISGAMAGVGKGMADYGKLMLVDTLENERNEATFLRKKALGISEREETQAFKTSEREAGQEFTAEQAALKAETDIKTAGIKAGAAGKKAKPNTVKMTDDEGVERIYEIGKDADGNTVMQEVKDIGAVPDIEDFQPTTEQLSRLSKQYEAEKEKEGSGLIWKDHLSGLNKDDWIKRRAFEESTGAAKPGLIAGAMGGGKPAPTPAPAPKQKTYSEAEYRKLVKSKATESGETLTDEQLNSMAAKRRKAGQITDGEKPAKKEPVKTTAEKITDIEAQLATDAQIKTGRRGTAKLSVFARNRLEAELKRLKSGVVRTGRGIVRKAEQVTHK